MKRGMWRRFRFIRMATTSTRSSLIPSSWVLGIASDHYTLSGFPLKWSGPLDSLRQTGSLWSPFGDPLAYIFPGLMGYSTIDGVGEMTYFAPPVLYICKFFWIWCLYGTPQPTPISHGSPAHDPLTA